MKNFIKPAKDFEDRNNISIAITLFSDGSSVTKEFWDEEELNESLSIDELIVFLTNTRYKLSKDDGRCLSPVIKI